MAAQRERRFEVILIDAASTDATVEKARAWQDRIGVPMRIVADAELLPIGEARNMGVDLARADAVAFLSADAEMAQDWVEQALKALEGADMVFGQQLHAPHRWTVGASVRGLRYHFPDGPADDPLVFASNVAAAYRRRVLQEFPFDPWANAAEDLLLARRAAAAGHRAVYVPSMVVHHHDVGTWRQEMRKNVREGHGCATYADELGLAREWLVWGGLVAAATAVASRRRAGFVLLAGALWLPTVRRLRRRGRHLPRRARLVAAAASPVFDVAFLLQYLRGLASRGRIKRADKPGPLPRPIQEVTP